MSTWREMFGEERKERGDDSPIVAVAPDESVLDVEFDADFGLSEGPLFTVWTADRVYFPAVYDGSEWVASVSRHPDGQPTRHVGNE